MAGKDQHSDGRPSSTQTSNVVRLRPRPWLESEEELVPIGTGNGESDASAEASAPAEPGHASTWLGAGEQTVPIDARQQTASSAAPDFWGDAADVQDALEAPAPRRADEGLGGAALPGGPVGADPASRRRFVPTPALAMVTAAAVAVIAAAINGFGSAPAAPRSPARSAFLPANASTRSTAAAEAGAAARLRMTQTADRHRATTDRVHLRTRANIATVRTTARREHRRSSVTATTARVRPAAPASPNSEPTPTSYGPVTPRPATSASSPTRAGPNGTVSLIGAGTSPSS